MQLGVIITKAGLYTTTQLKSGLFQIKLKLAYSDLLIYLVGI